ncbi:hypothetical protein [Chromobacterium haemolyticum]|uniref:hypothetical protein n=1 Tax=Chromobacterium haemolyticum TaxID=394935 RepID=UPI0009DAA110|nr:hypothetical protein [Chromobacterium haemolyticum]OQS42972.1 hypothetical protein B0T39_05000 [Chromobacterium haemolyticum]
MPTRIFVIALCAFLLSACAGMAERLRGSLEPPAERGYAILSLTGKSSNPDSATLGLDIANAAGRIVAADSASLLTDTVFGEQGKSMTEGKLMLFTLEPGQYRVEQVWANWLEDGAWGVSRKMRGFRLAAPFEVKRGEAVYLGNVDVEMSFLPETRLRDESGRDLAHIRRIWKIKDVSGIQLRPLGQAHP